MHARDGLRLGVRVDGVCLSIRVIANGLMFDHVYRLITCLNDSMIKTIAIWLYNGIIVIGKDIRNIHCYKCMYVFGFP